MPGLLLFLPVACGKHGKSGASASLPAAQHYPVLVFIVSPGACGIPGIGLNRQQGRAVGGSGMRGKGGRAELSFGGRRERAEQPRGARPPADAAGAGSTPALPVAHPRQESWVN